MDTHFLILDTDPGIDDSMAIALIGSSPEIELHSVTTVFGNGPVSISSANALRVLDIVGMENVDVYEGANNPLLREYHGEGAKVHGSDGLGETFMPRSPRGVQSEYAACHIVDSIMSEPGKYTLAAIGPLTNLATALCIEPRIANNVREVVIMGGAVGVPGNASPVAEANIYNDPEAASLVYGAGWNLTAVGLDVTQQILMDEKYLDALTESQTPVTSMISAIIPFYLDFHRNYRGQSVMPVHDSSAIAYLIDPDLFSTKSVCVHVVVSENRCSGQTVADWNNRWCEGTKIKVCVNVDAERILRIYQERVGGNNT